MAASLSRSLGLGLVLSLIIVWFSACDAQVPGFRSIDCGGNNQYTDELGLNWEPDTQFPFGQSANISIPTETRKQYTTLRYFPADTSKYCYPLNVTTRTRYLLRATFLYGNFDNSNVFPKFDLSIDASHWSNVVIYDMSTVVSKEVVFLASSSVVSVCVSNALTGQPFISTLELRQLNGSLYYTDFETKSFLSLSARINFGALSEEPVRYPDDSYDRIWQSDTIKKANFLVDVAPGTTNISTTEPIDISSGAEKPPQKVMQTAVVGMNGTLSYRLNLPGFPGFGWAFSYFSEIEELGPSDTRKFKLVIQGLPDVNKPTVNVLENAAGMYRVYEPGYYNISLPFTFPFKFRKTNDSTKGPILNALEIYKYLPINSGSSDASSIDLLASRYSYASWAQEGGDPCLPIPRSWVRCTDDLQPSISSIVLSGRNLTGNIPEEITKLPRLVEIWLDGNNLTGTIPDFSGCPELRIIHLENNQLTGGIPSSLSSSPNLQELYLQNNMLSGVVPRSLLNKNKIFNYSGNVYLRKERNTKKDFIIIICSMIGVAFILAAISCSCFLSHKRFKFFSKEDDVTKVPPPPPPQKLQTSSFDEFASVTAHRYSFSELERATSNFEKNIGSGGFGVVYYGKTKDEKEIAVKVLTNESAQGRKQFSNEVSLLSRIHHRNLVSFLGYCPQEGKNMLVYEFMHNGTLKEHLHGLAAKENPLSWLRRLEIAEDSARGIEYLHTGCTPTIIHRDIKTSNILLDKNMRAKVADFGLSKLVADETYASTIVRGTVGYLDPDYYTNQQLTEKSDVYSFGVILFELLSGQPPLCGARLGEKYKHVKDWAKFHYETGDIRAIIDPSLEENYRDIQSIWKIAETAVRCTNIYSTERPTMSEVLQEIQDAIALEQAPVSGAVAIPVFSDDTSEYPDLR
ncbi:hypothetical protein LUZ63_012221 [Rhynchospora breviuscula]|uniref:non-specific serine/threonine protein kinase n=1 Tax=Rhynchospora breviuscula TaxID=2022672 RepID=A0A9Q0CKI0_9POAL|nr:hypothetical protein LUZ63_012221 [Rhynchospora breviuscula]